MAQLSNKLPWELANPKWAATLNPILALPILQGNLISNISLTASTSRPINHLLGRIPIGWFLTDNDSQAVVWRSAESNQYTITLESDANTTISIWVF